MKKLSVLLAVLLLCSLLASCGPAAGGTTTATTTAAPADSTPTQVVTTTVNGDTATTTAGGDVVPTGDTPISTTADTPVNTTGNIPVNTTGNAPVNTTGNTPVNTTINAPVNTTGNTPVNTTVNTPVNTTAKPTTTTTVKPVVNTTAKPTTAPTHFIDVDHAWQANPGSLYEPINSKFDAQANAIKAAMDAAKDTLKPAAGCTAYYVSFKGNDGNNGKSPAAAFKTVEPLRDITFRAGDVVLFERGGVYRVPTMLVLTSGVSYGAYGTGVRPCIYGSERNYANDQWIQVDTNVWTLAATYPGDVGCIVFNHGEKWAQWVETRGELDKEMEFWSDLEKDGKVYLYTATNPNGKYRSIEIGHDGQLFNFNGKSNITIENLTFKYTGGHATRGSNTKNITIRGCEYGFIGGSILHYTAGQATRYGNGAEFMESSENTLIENCWFYQIYDSATTTQANGANCIAKNFTLRNTLIEYSGMAAYEFWGCKQINITLQNNVMRFAGFGHGGMKNSNGFLRAFIQSNYRSASGTPVLYLENFKVINNVFDQSDYQLINFCFGEQSKNVVVDGNTWCQVKNNKRRPLGYFKVVKQLYFDKDAETTIKDVIGDKNATVTYA